MPWSPLGQPATVSRTVTTVAGVPADAGSILVKLYGPTGTLVRTYPGPAHDGVGLYHQDIPAADLATVGHYRYDWVATGANAGEWSEVLDVFDPATYPRIVSLTDAQTFLPLRTTDPVQVALLDRVIGWASARIMIETVAYRTTYTQRVQARYGRLVLSRTPVREVVAIAAVNGGAIAVAPSSLLVLNPAHGLVGADSGAYLNGLYDVTYEAGPDEIVPGTDGACLQLIQHWWNQSQAHGSATYGDAGFVPDFNDLPNSVRNKLAAAAPPVLMA